MPEVEPAEVIQNNKFMVTAGKGEQKCFALSV